MSDLARVFIEHLLQCVKQTDNLKTCVDSIFVSHEACQVMGTTKQALGVPAPSGGEVRDLVTADQCKIVIQ